jgi:hypothetical protein
MKTASVPDSQLHSPVPAPDPIKRSSAALPLAVTFVMGLSLIPLLVLAGFAIGFSIVLAVLVTSAAAVLIMIWPVSGLFMTLGCTLVIEQNPLQYHIVTDQLNVFYWPPSLAGLIERPIGFLMLFTLFLTLCHRLARRQGGLSGGPLLWPFLGYLACVAMGVIHGLATGGDLKIIALEIRPFWYLFLSYLLAYNLISQLKHIRLFFWFVIIAAGFKGLQGCYIYFIVLHGNVSNQNEIMAHEESFFFVALILLVVLFSLLYRYRPQIYAALAVLPPVLIAMIANKRRADYIALLLALAVVWVFLFYLKPQMRKALVGAMVLSLVLGTAYVIAFAHGTGSLAEPARAIVSVIDPSLSDTRDLLSNMYRNIENYDLKYTVHQNPLLGMGFGKEFLRPLPLPVLDTSNPDFGGNPYLFVPHNTIYWIWMRLGPIGYIALWYLLGSMIVRGGIIARQLRQPYLRLIAVYVVAVVCMEIIVAYADYQLFFYRNVIYLGLLAGLLMRLPAVDEQLSQATETKPARADRAPQLLTSEVLR